ncbi:MAG TPA: tetratricopeptide repeat protein [Herpetosiphonaceae bacterium]|nr:tetratricopeptide repeat protein [Herpetosiphonaceae bacterium]
MMESPAAYIPVDRRLAIAHGQELPDHSFGATLFADISGFTPLTEALVRALGPQRGAEELPRQLNLIYDALITEVDRYGGSVIGFAGDAITCWFPDDDGHRATACALAIQQTMQQFASVKIPGVAPVALAIKVAVATGAVRRFLVGDPQIQTVDVLAGETLQRLAAGEHEANKGEVIVDAETLTALDDEVEVVELRTDDEKGRVFAVVRALTVEVTPSPWPALALDALPDAQVSPWLLPPVYERLRSGMGEFLTELRPAVPLFMRFGGIDYDEDENAGEQLDAFIRWVQGILERYGGYLIQLTIGDKGSFLYTAFGAPLAHDNDAARAAAAALELRALPPELGFIRNVQIGISQGRVRTGAYGGTTRRTYGVLGDEVNLAARLMQNAPIGEVLVSEVARKSSGEAFSWETLPPLRVKGKSTPITVFRLIAHRSRQAVRLNEPRYALPMVGRMAELNLISDKLAQATAGEGQIVGITAEAGMGKSRLVAEIMRVAAERGVRIFASECQSYGTNNSYHVWDNIWRAFFGLDADQPVEVQQQVLEQRLAAIDPVLVPRVPLLGLLLNLPIPDNDLTRPLDAKLRKASLEALLVDCLRAGAKTEPMLIILEDCHWLDPLSHDLLEALGRVIGDLPVGMVVAYRPPELERVEAPRVTRLPYCTVISLGEFSSEEAAQLIELKLQQFGAGDGSVPPALVEQLSAKAQGNPFYIEELLNYLRDRGVDPQDVQALERLELPNSLYSLILSRIDQLNERQKITLRVASIVGRLFRLQWLWGVHPQLGEPVRVKAELESMRSLDLTPLDQPEPELTYLFKHIMTREVAYESLPFATRALLHGHLAHFIEDTYQDALDQHLDLLAYHYDLSNDEPKKREYLRKAGEAAQAAFANDTAIDYFQRLLPKLPEDDKPPVLMHMGQVLDLVGEWDGAAAFYGRALAIVGSGDGSPIYAEALHAIGGLLRKRGDYPEAVTWLQRARTGFEQLKDPAGVSRVLADLGEVYRLQGQFAEANARYSESLELAESIETVELRLAARANALKGAGTVANAQGNRARARALYEESLALRRQLGDRPGEAALLNNLGVVARFQGDYATARSLNAQSLAVFRELGDRWSAGQLLNNDGVLTADLGNYDEARHILAESLMIRRQLGDKAGLALTLNSLGDVLLDEGDLEGARPVLEESLMLNRELEDSASIAYLLDDFAGLAAGRGDSERALRLAGAAAAIRQVVGASLSPAEQARFDRLLRPAWQAEGEIQGARAWEEGRSMSIEQAMALIGE